MFQDVFKKLNPESLGMLLKYGRKGESRKISRVLCNFLHSLNTLLKKNVSIS